jgi:hypothetical protein
LIGEGRIAHSDSNVTNMQVCSNRMSEENRGKFALAATRDAFAPRATRDGLGVSSPRSDCEAVLELCSLALEKIRCMGIPPRFNGMIQGSGK